MLNAVYGHRVWPRWHDGPRLWPAMLRNRYKAAEDQSRPAGSGPCAGQPAAAPLPLRVYSIWGMRSENRHALSIFERF